MAKGSFCIRRTGTIEEAGIIVAWLAERGVEATVLDRDNPGVLAFGVTDVEGIAVVVADEDTARRASVLLQEHDQEVAAVHSDEGSGNMTELTCGECGEVASFPSDAAGGVQECPNCGAFLDLPGTDG